MSDISAGQHVRTVSFAQSSENALGVGKLLAIDGGCASVEYFSSPCHKPAVLTVAARSVRRIALDEQTRVYFFDPDGVVWRTGRSLIATEDGAYVVAFPNQDVRTVHCDRLYVRCDSLIDEPTDFLAGRVTESPFLHERRSRLANAFAEQRGAVAGMTGLLSAGIELEPHQIEVVRRVLQNPAQRYLLADEVGLGKTIEAGIIIRQFVLDDPTGHQILVVVPPHLVDQWVAELSRRFTLDCCTGSAVRVVSFNQVDAALATGQPRMLVIDEAHQLAALVAAPAGSTGHLRFRRVCEAAVRAERLLLLSATPSLHNEAGFQAMLHLLDPTVYPLGDLEAFRVRRDWHQRVAELFHVFHSVESGSFLNDCLDDLTAMFPADAHLRALAAQLRPLLAYGQDPTSDRRADLIQDIRCHVSEAYRLHRRLLRNRRADPRVEPILPGRHGLALWEYDDPASSPLGDLLEEWRTIAAQRAAADPAKRDELAECLRLFWDAFADPLALVALAAARRGEADHEQLAGLALTPAEVAALGSVPLFDEEDILRRLVDTALQLENLERADAVAAKIDALWVKQPDFRVVLFTTFPRTADEVRDALAARWRTGVVRHGQTGWERSWADKAARVLVCDRSAEEGLNLQGGRIALVHYDMPMSPNRIEQRLGRVDRYGVGPPFSPSRPSPARQQFPGRGSICSTKRFACSIGRSPLCNTSSRTSCRASAPACSSTAPTHWWPPPRDSAERKGQSRKRCARSRCSTNWTRLRPPRPSRISPTA